MENLQKREGSDEIDLGQLLSKIGDSIRNVGLAFLRFLALIRKIPVDNKGLF